MDEKSARYSFLRHLSLPSMVLRERGENGAIILSLVLLLLIILLLLRYSFLIVMYHKTHLHHTDKQVPPTFPYLLPILGNTILFAFDTANFIKRATWYAGSSVPVRLSVLMQEFFFIQGPENIAAVWREQQLGSPIQIYAFALENVFNMPKRALAPYKADNSGSNRKPHPQSSVLPHNRVDFLTHSQFSNAFRGSGLNTCSRRCSGILKDRFDSLAVSSEEWTEMTDLYSFFLEHLGSAIIEGLYGPGITKVNSQFINDLWAFDTAAPKFVKLMPRFLIPDAYRTRERLIKSIQHWYAYARANFQESDIGPDGDADPYWGSELMRSRQKVLLAVDAQDDEAIASADLGLIWATVTNLVPSAMMCAFYIFRSPELSNRMRSSLGNTFSVDNGQADMENLLRKPLLSSIYAETLRLHVQAHVTRASPHTDVKIGSWCLPRNSVCMVNTYASHMDESFWNTRDGEFPVESFWPERFLIDPKDPQSGPVRHDVPTSRYKRPMAPDVDHNKDEPFFSVRGLDGAWIPYSGGHAACPGRHFAKRMIFYTTALLLSKFEVQLMSDRLEVDFSRFGLGTQRPKHMVPFRIRRRTADH